VYDPDGRITYCGNDISVKLRMEHAHCDRLRREYDSMRRRFRRRGEPRPSREEKQSMARLYRRWRKAEARLTRRIQELHKTTAAWLLSSYIVVILSDCSTQQMVRRGGKLSKSTRRAFLRLAHYRFRQVVKSQQRFAPWCLVMEVSAV
jgi:transposase